MGLRPGRHVFSEEVYEVGGPGGARGCTRARGTAALNNGACAQRATTPSPGTHAENNTTSNRKPDGVMWQLAQLLTL